MSLLVWAIDVLLSVNSPGGNLLIEFVFFDCLFVIFTKRLSHLLISAHQALEEKAEKALSAIEKEEKLKKQLDDQNAKLTRERDELLAALDEEKGSISDYHAKQQKLQAQKKQLEKQLQVRNRV